ncbi:Hsp20/alpha crystallin family protein, partial [Streptomyces californicus]
MLMRTDPFRELDRITEQLLRPGTWSRPAAMAKVHHPDDRQIEVEVAKNTLNTDHRR